MSLEILGIDASRATSWLKTGTEWYSRNIISALAQLSDRPMLRLYQRDAERFIDGKNIEWTPILRSRLWTHAALASELKKRPVDALFVPAHVIPWRHPDATVVTIHDLGYRSEPDTHTVTRRVDLELSTRWNTIQARRIICPSVATRNDLETMYGVDPGRVDVIPHGVDHDRFRQIDSTTVSRNLESLGIERPYLLFVSTIQPRKNLSRLIAAFESLDHPMLNLVVAGAAGWKSNAILARMRLSARAANITHLGYVADEVLPSLYNGAAAYVAPSLNEGFGMGILEAMACGCPTVISCRASMPEIAGEAAVVVDPVSVRDIRNGILQAIDPGTSDRLRKRGLAQARQFTWERAASQTMNSILRAYQETRG